MTNYHGVGARQGPMHVITPHNPTPIPIDARHPQTNGGTPKAKQPPTLVPAPPNTVPTAVKHAEQAIGPALILGSETKRIKTNNMALLF